MALTANQIRALRALRAGPLAVWQAQERWASGTEELYSLVCAGLAEKVGEEFRIIPAGRAACPPVNPLLARTPAEPKEQTPMPRNKTTTSDVFDAICAAGPDGTNVIALSNLLAVSDQTIFNHLKSLTREPGAVVRRPRKGLLVASRYLDGAPENADEPAVAEAPGVPEAEVEKHARDYAEMIDFDIEAAQSLDLTAAPATTAAATPKIAVATPDVAPGNPVDRDEELIRQARTIIDLRAMVAEQQDKIAELLAREGTKLVVADVIIDDAETVEFAVYSSGGLDCITGGPLVSLSAAAFAKMRRFLGLFAEAA